MIRRVQFRAIVVLITAVFVVGCGVPNVEPFAEATVELRRAIVEGGAMTAEAMTTAAATLPGDDANEDAEQFVEIWGDRVKLADVLVGYSDALAGIAGAGVGAQQTAEALGSSIMQLADIVPGTGAAVDAGVRLGEVLVRAGIQVKASKDLGQAVDAAHPALAQVADYLQEDFGDLAILYKKASQDMEKALDDEYGRSLDGRRRLLDKVSKLRLAVITDPNDENIERVKKVEEVLALMEPEHEAYMQRRHVLSQTRTAAIEMFSQAKAGVRAWIQAHDDLKLAIEQNRQPNVRLILSTAQEIKEAVDRIRDL
jgi:hypothetical protein